MKTIEDWILTSDKEARMEDYAFAAPFAPQPPTPISGFHGDRAMDSPGGLGIVPVSLGTPGNPMTRQERPVHMDEWTLVPGEGSKDHAREQAVVQDAVDAGGDVDEHMGCGQQEESPAGARETMENWLAQPGNEEKLQQSIQEILSGPPAPQSVPEAMPMAVPEATPIPGGGEGEAFAMLDNWNFVDSDKEAHMEDYAFMLPVQMGLPPGMKAPSGGARGEPPPEPPPPAEVRRMLADNMRDMGRSLMISGMKPPRPQMMAIANALEGLLDQLEMLADQPGRKALQRRILLNMRPKIMNPGK